MPRLAEPALRPFLAVAGQEFDRAATREGVVERVLRFGEARVRLRFAGVELADTLLAAFDDRSDSGDGHAHSKIELWEGRSCPEEPVRCPWSAADIGPGGLVSGSDAERVVALHEPHSGTLTLVDRRRRSLLHRVSSAPDVPWWERAAPLRAALFWALEGTGHLVHAGAVGDERGCVLLAGGSGSGKTTVALAALVHGPGYLSDDYVLLLDEARDPRAAAIYGTAKLDQGHLRRFDSLAPLVRFPPALEAEQKAVLDVAKTMPDAMHRYLPVRAVVVPRICGGTARVRAISSAQALLALAPSSALQLPFGDGAVVRALALLVRRVPCWALDVGDDTAELAGAVERVLGEATS
jgi:hypothetical protein